MKKLLKILICLIFSILIVASQVVSAASLSGDNIISQDDYNDSFYVPPYYDITKATFSIDADSFSIGSSTIKHEYDAKSIDLTEGLTKEGYYSITFYKGIRKFKYKIFMTSQIPNVYIETSKGLNYIHQNKNNRDKEATIRIYDENGKIVYDDILNGSTSELKGRGNATWGLPKKPYQIKLGKKTDLFNMGKSKTWVLLANYIDSSYIRNTVSFEIAKTLNVPYAIESTFVDLYIDGIYQGLYQLCEKVQIGTNRIEIEDLEDANDKMNPDIDYSKLSITTVSSGDFIKNSCITAYTYAKGINNPENITGGFLLEIDNLYGRREPCYFRTDSGNTYVVKSPEYCSKEQMEYIASFVSEMEDALISETGYNFLGKHYSEYCDIDSMVRYYVVQEITKNWDAYMGSTFLYKDADKDGEISKVYAGPGWDFDNAYGNLNRGTFGTDKESIWARGNNKWDKSYINDFGLYVVSHKEIEKSMCEYYDIAYNFTLDMLKESGFVNTTANKIMNSIKADKNRWPDAKHEAYKQYSTYVDYNDLDLESTALGALRTFMYERAIGLKQFFKYSNNEEIENTTTQNIVSTTASNLPISSQTEIITTTNINPVTTIDQTINNATTVANDIERNNSFIIPVVIISFLTIAIIVIVFILIKNKKHK